MADFGHLLRPKVRFDEKIAGEEEAQMSEAAVTKCSGELNSQKNAFGDKVTRK